jgi:opacity protein-like surface antigen
MKRLLFALVSAAGLAGGVVTAIAADLAPYYRAPPPVLVRAFSWTGFYIGANVGGAATSINELWSPLPSSATFGAFPIAGSTGGASFTGGFQAGYNWQFAPTWVAGIEGDWSWADARGNINQPWVLDPSGAVVAGSVTSMSSTLDWVSSIRARLGYLITPTLMAYGTAGGAWGKIDYAANNFAPGHSPTIRHQRGLLQHPGRLGGRRRARMGVYAPLAAEGRISLLRSQRLPIGGGSLRQLSGIAVGIFVEQHQRGRGAGGLELQVLIPQQKTPSRTPNPRITSAGSWAAVWLGC